MDHDLRNHVVSTIIQILAYRELAIDLGSTHRTEYMATPMLALYNTADVELEWLDTQVTRGLLEEDHDLWSYHALLAQLSWWSKRILRTMPSFRAAPIESQRLGVVMNRLDRLADHISA
jgi:hypothetical protein